MKISNIEELLYNGIMLNENEYVEVEGRKYINPQLAIDESNAFIDNLRQTQNAQNAQIASDTQALGTNVPSNLGGLTGGEGYWTSRYQTPQTNALVQDLRTAAQASALNDVLANEQAIWKKRYQDAYKAAQRRANARSGYGGGGSGGGGGGAPDDNNPNDIVLDPTDGHYVYWLGQDGNVWVNKNGQTSNLGAANMVNGQWDGMASGSAGSMSGNGTKINDPVPPNPDNYYITGEEQTKRVQERSGLPEWIVNTLKIFG